ncbi:unnamed protein product [Zymoseptoria tritici ST99CH_1A5]|uniref:Uncharacterized protein n=2 Tax=Zymoseptoria tritici TaxID=1047171 RepID=A0A2H1GZE7_ZYMTR|nr:unnamed protein product [Zymoseptoria tritici ST99CH_1E4]SMR62779.1 unnamed protein product [Zymoseptoria tritici ST99CH_3D1]SMY28146.1 unnamed protein product [Zymoseptoria tritici ST99CH_1A5]
MTMEEVDQGKATNVEKAAHDVHSEVFRNGKLALHFTKIVEIFLMRHEERRISRREPPGLQSMAWMAAHRRRAQLTTPILSTMMMTTPTATATMAKATVRLREEADMDLAEMAAQDEVVEVQVVVAAQEAEAALGRTMAIIAMAAIKTRHQPLIPTPFH